MSHRISVPMVTAPAVPHRKSTPMASANICVQTTYYDRMRWYTNCIKRIMQHDTRAKLASHSAADSFIPKPMTPVWSIVPCNFRWIPFNVLHYFETIVKIIKLTTKAGWFAHPIFSKSGGYPPVMQYAINSNSIREGRSWSRLPTLTPQWIDLIRGSADFLGLNYYTSRLVKLADQPEGPSPSWQRDTGLSQYVHPDWKQSHSKWLYSVPQGFGDILRFVRLMFPNLMCKWKYSLIYSDGWMRNITV